MKGLDFLKLNLENIFQNNQSLFFNIEKKIWVYNNNTLVLDFFLDGERFAYDFYYENNSFCIDYIKREVGESECVYTADDNNVKEGFNIFFKHFKSLKDKCERKYDFKISIIVPVYNRENLIKSCIESINNQKNSFENFEVVFVDDYSSDSSIKTIENLISEKVNYRILRRPINSGSASSPRNDGIKASKGEFVLFLDSDDYLYDYTINDLLEIVNKENPDITYLKINGDKGRPFGIRPYKNGDVLKASIHKDHLVRSLMPSKLIRKSLLIKNNIYFPIDIKVGEDRVFLIQALSKAKKISILANRPYYYLVNHDQERLTFAHQTLEQDLELVSRTMRYISRSNLNIEEKRKFFSSWMNVILESYVKNRIKSNKNSRKNKIAYIKSIIREYSFYPELHDDSCIYPEFKVLYKYFVSYDLENLFKVSVE